MFLHNFTLKEKKHKTKHPPQKNKNKKQKQKPKNKNKNQQILFWWDPVEIVEIDKRK